MNIIKSLFGIKSVRLMTIACVMSSTFGISSAFCQDISKDELASVMERIPILIRENFVVKDVGVKVANGIERNYKSGKYNEIKTYDQLVKTVTKDLRDLSNDLHLYLRKNEVSKAPSGAGRSRRMVPASGRGTPSGSGSRYDRFRDKDGKMVSFKRLDGNVLYIKVGMFAALDEIKNEIDGALEVSKSADAIIIDLMGCPGGHGSTVSYLAGGIIAKDTLLSTHYTKQGRFEGRSVVTPYGKINNDKPVFVLTSRRSFSACEAFPFFLQEVGRVKVVGEQTRGGGRTTRLFPLNEKLSISISHSIAVSSKGNQFQGVGVKPDFPTSKEKALEVAHKQALKAIKSKKGRKSEAK